MSPFELGFLFLKRENEKNLFFCSSPRLLLYRFDCAADVGIQGRFIMSRNTLGIIKKCHTQYWEHHKSQKKKVCEKNFNRANKTDRNVIYQQTESKIFFSLLFSDVCVRLERNLKLKNRRTNLILRFV
jgi:hypothetical protein